MREVIEHHLKRIADCEVLSSLGLREQQYFLISVHREENIESPENLRKIFQILNALSDCYNYPVLVSTHPRTRKRIESLGLVANERVIFHKPFGFIDYVKLQMCAKVVLSDSGTITEESSILNFPALNLREVHERPEGFEEAAVMMVGLSSERVLQALHILEKQPRGERRLFPMVADYAPVNVSEKVLRIILSYTDFVNRRVWGKLSGG